MHPEIIVSHVDEETEHFNAMSPVDMVIALAITKAHTVREQIEGDAIIIGCDSTFEFEGESLGKPGSAENAINRAKGNGTAEALNGRTVVVKLPTQPGERVAFMADVENLAIQRAVPAAKIIINARTGSIVMNQAVTLGPCAVAHGALSVTINSTPVISQPNALSQGQTVVTEKADIKINSEPGSLIQMPAGTKLTDVVKALNSLGANPQDLLAILQAMKAAGALQAELEVI